MSKRLIVWTFTFICFTAFNSLQGQPRSVPSSGHSLHSTLFERQPFPGNPADHYKGLEIVTIKPSPVYLFYHPSPADSGSSSPRPQTVAYASSGTYPASGDNRPISGIDRPPGEWLELKYACLSTFEAGEVFDPIPAFFTYVLLPRSGNGVWLTAHIPEWKQWSERYDSLQLFCNNRHVSLRPENQSDTLPEDTLSLPLFQEKGIFYKWESLEDEKAVSTKIGREENHGYRITVKNSRPFAVPLTIREYYPVSTSPQIKVYLTESDGAEVEETDGSLTWEFRLAPNEEQSVTFSYTVTYPKEGQIECR